MIVFFLLFSFSVCHNVSTLATTMLFFAYSGQAGLTSGILSQMPLFILSLTCHFRSPSGASETNMLVSLSAWLAESLQICMSFFKGCL